MDKEALLEGMKAQAKNTAPIGWTIKIVEDDDVVVNGEGDLFLPAFFKTAGEGGRADDESREMEESTRAASADTVSPGVVPTQSL